VLSIYLDHHATTPVDPRVLDEMLPYFCEEYGNAASTDHTYGSRAQRAVTRARRRIAELIGARPQEIIFTSGATESNNLAIAGVARRYQDKGMHIVTSCTEHPSVLDTCRYLEHHGWEVTYLPVDSEGLVCLDTLEAAIRDDTVLVSIMAANNEIGTLAPLQVIGEVTRLRNVFFHVDGAQAFGHVPVDTQAMNIDLLSVSGHKIYGPKGVGALYVRNSNPRVFVEPIIYGGGHERGMRSGTLNVPGIVGLGKAAEVAGEVMRDEADRLSALRNLLWELLDAKINGTHLNGHPQQRLPHNLNVAFDGVEAKAMINSLGGIAVSTGSACSTAKVEPSHVIQALGFGEQRAYSSIRFGLGRSTTEDDVRTAADQVSQVVGRLRKLHL